LFCLVFSFSYFFDFCFFLFFFFFQEKEQLRSSKSPPLSRPSLLLAARIMMHGRIDVVFKLVFFVGLVFFSFFLETALGSRGCGLSYAE